MAERPPTREEKKLQEEERVLSIQLDGMETDAARDPRNLRGGSTWHDSDARTSKKEKTDKRKVLQNFDTRF